MDKRELLKLLKETQAETKGFFALGAGELAKTYGEGKWNIRQILHHLTDTEILFQGRLKKVIAEPFQVIWAFDPDDWAKAFSYIDAPLDGKEQVYTIFRDMNYRLIDEFYDDHIRKEFVHSKTGLRTLKDEFEKVAVHNRGHNEQVKIALSM
jgi:hypothetical protein